MRLKNPLTTTVYVLLPKENKVAEAEKCFPKEKSVSLLGDLRKLPQLHSKPSGT